MNATELVEEVYWGMERRSSHLEWGHEGEMETDRQADRQEEQERNRGNEREMPCTWYTWYQWVT